MTSRTGDDDAARTGERLPGGADEGDEAAERGIRGDVGAGKALAVPPAGVGAEPREPAGSFSDASTKTDVATAGSASSSAARERPAEPDPAHEESAESLDRKLEHRPQG